MFRILLCTRGSFRFALKPRQNTHFSARLLEAALHSAPSIEIVFKGHEKFFQMKRWASLPRPLRGCSTGLSTAWFH